MHSIWESPMELDKPADEAVVFALTGIRPSASECEDNEKEARRAARRRLRCRRMAIVEADFPLVLRAYPEDLACGTQCDECEDVIRERVRYKCLQCPNYDLCVSCHGERSDCPGMYHDVDHVFIQLVRSGASTEPYVAILPRAMSVRQSRTA